MLKALHLMLGVDRVRVALNQDAPAFTARLVIPVRLEANWLVGMHRQQRVRPGADDDGLSRHREVDRQDHDSGGGCEPDAADAAW
jgi:hypothetical protein